MVARPFLDGLAKAGVVQLNVLAPATAEAAIREIARRTKAGEPLRFVLDSVATRNRNMGKTGTAADYAKLLDALPPAEPGFVLVACALGSKAMGNHQRRFKTLAAGLVRASGAHTGRGGAFVGSLPEAVLDELRALVETCGGRIETRRGAA